MTAPAPRNHPAEDAWFDRFGDVWTQGADGLMHSPETASFPREHVEKKWGPLTPIGDMPTTAHPAPTPALDAVLAEAEGRARNQSGTCTGEHCEGCESGRRIARARAELAALTPRPESVVAPLPSEAVRETLVRDILKALRTAWQDDYSTRTVAEGVADAMLAAGYRLVPEDDEDTVRVPRVALIELNAAVMERRDLVDAIEEFNDEVRS